MKNLPRGTLKRKIEEVANKYSIDPSLIKQSSIHTRIQRGNLSVSHRGVKSLIKEIENRHEKSTKLAKM